MKTIHVAIDIGSLLRSRRAIRGLLVDGKKANDENARAALLEKLASGVRKLPLGERCEGFSDVTGCPGHGVSQ